MNKHPLLTKAALAIICITALALTAILKGQDGVLLLAAFSVIAGLGGFMVGKATKPK